MNISSIVSGMALPVVHPMKRREQVRWEKVISHKGGEEYFKVAFFPIKGH